MKYYLETNALRALGGRVHENKTLRDLSYTSLFAVFELIKGIDNRSDSQARKNIILNIINTDISIVSAMPFELMRSAFTNVENRVQSKAVIDQLRNLVNNEDLIADGYQALIDNYESDTLEFQRMSNVRYVRPKPEPRCIKFDLETMFDEPEVDIPIGVKNLPQDVHPSRIAMEMLKVHLAPKTFKIFFDDKGCKDEEILSYYNNSLDLFFFASHSYDLKKYCLRESSAKSDLLDILHTVYLFGHDSVIVSNDKIFDSILPNINQISVEEYKKLI